MRALFFSFYVLVSCNTDQAILKKNDLVDYIQINAVGRTFQLPKEASTQLARQYRGKGEFNQVMQALALERWDSVIGESKKHLKKYPGNEDALMLLALGYLGKGNLDLADFYGQLLIKANPQDSMTLNLLGTIRKQQAVLMEDYREAISFFNLANLASPQSGIPLLNLGLIHMEIGNFEAASLYFKAAKDNCPTCKTAALGVALAAQAMGRFSEAKIAFEQFLQANPQDPLAHYLLAVQTYYVDQDLEKSRKLFELALSQENIDEDMKNHATDLITRIDRLDSAPAVNSNEADTTIMSH